MEASALASPSLVAVQLTVARPLEYLSFMRPSMAVTSPGPVSIVTTGMPPAGMPDLGSFTLDGSAQVPFSPENVNSPQFTTSFVLPTTSRARFTVQEGWPTPAYRITSGSFTLGVGTSAPMTVPPRVFQPGRKESGVPVVPGMEFPHPSPHELSVVSSISAGVSRLSPRGGPGSGP